MSGPRTLDIFWHPSCTHTTKKTVRAPGIAPSISEPGWKKIRKLRLLHGRARSCECSSTKLVEDQGRVWEFRAISI